MEQLRTLEEISRELVGVQLKIAKLKKWEKELLPFDQKGPAAQVAAFVGPQALKIVVPLYAPKFQVHPGLFIPLTGLSPRPTSRCGASGSPAFGRAYGKMGKNFRA